MRASALLGWRIAAVVVFGVTAALAVTLTRGAPPHAALTSARHPGHPGQAAHPGQAGARAVAAPCVASGLRISIGAGPRAAGSYPLVFTNVSRASCTLSGYPAVAAYRGDHVRVGNPAGADTSGPGTGGAAAAPAARRVVLVPGATAHAALTVDTALTVNTGLRRGACRPVAAAGLRVLAPGGSVPRYIRHPLTACSAAGPRAPVFLRVRSLQPGPA